NATQLILGIPVLISMLGIIIINNNLSKYEITDYNIIRPQTIYVGSLFLFIVFVIFIYYCMLLNMVEVEKNNILYLIILTFIKTVLLCILFYYLFIDDFNEMTIFRLTL
ncbi:unnamed protein product, partial [marine sediment metagenome]